MVKIIDQLIINSPYEEPKEYWDYNETNQSFDRKSGRRSAGYYIANQGTNQFNEKGNFIPLPLVNEIRKRVKTWKTNNYPGNDNRCHLYFGILYTYNGASSLSTTFMGRLPRRIYTSPGSTW